MEDAHTLIISQTGGGKTVLASYLLNNNKFKSSENALKILITDLSEEIKKDTVPLQYNISKKNIARNLNNKNFERIKKYTMTANNSNDTDEMSKPFEKRICYVIVDDLNKLIDVKSANTKKEIEDIKQTKSNLNFIFTEGRHLGIYCIALIQYYKALPPLIRNNARYHIITFGSNSIIETLWDHVSGYFDSKEELKKFVYTENIDHTSIIFDTHNASRDKKDNIMLCCPPPPI